MSLLVITQVVGPTDDVRALVGELEEVLSAEYPAEQRHGLSLDAIFEPHVRFFIASRDGVAYAAMPPHKIVASVFLSKTL